MGNRDEKLCQGEVGMIGPFASTWLRELPVGIEPRIAEEAEEKETASLRQSLIE